MTTPFRSRSVLINTIMVRGAVACALMLASVSMLPAQTDAAHAASRADTVADAGPRLHAYFRLIKPRVSGRIVGYARADTVLFDASIGGAVGDVVACNVEIRRGPRTMSVPIAPGSMLTMVLPAGDRWRSALDTTGTEPPFVAQLVVRSRDGAVHRSPAITIPACVADSRFERRTRAPGMRVNRYSLCLFQFDRAELGALNRRILEREVYGDIGPDAEIEVIGHMDIVGQPEHNVRLSERRAAAVASAIRVRVPLERMKSLEERGVGSAGPLYSNALPEGRFYNRTTQVIVYNPE